jgi:hypothetical protein
MLGKDRGTAGNDYRGAIKQDYKTEVRVGEYNVTEPDMMTKINLHRHIFNILDVDDSRVVHYHVSKFPTTMRNHVWSVKARSSRFSRCAPTSGVATTSSLPSALPTLLLISVYAGHR